MADEKRSRNADSQAPFVSIVLPCYGVERYVDQALDDLQAQTFGDWELIAVDDASPDASAERVRARMAGDVRIKLVSHAENRGLSAARNTGLAHARGRYVWMPDPDDRYDPELLAEACAALGAGWAAGELADVALFGCVEEYRDERDAVTEEHAVLPGANGLLAQEELRGAVLGFEERTLYGYAWNKLYRRNLLDGLAFGDTPLVEDILFSIRVFDRAQTCAVVDKGLYRYAKRTASNLTNRFVPRYFEVHRLRVEELYRQQERWGLATPEVRSRLGSLYGRYILSALERNCDARAQMTHAQRAAWCRALVRDDLFRTLIPGAHSRSGTVLEVSLLILKTRCVPAYLALGRVIHVVRARTSGGYAHLKMQR